MTTPRKGIIMAGGSGTRLYPLTHTVSKQLLPLYDKPMIYYPLSIMMLTHVRDVAIISTPRDLPLYRDLLGDGAQWGMRLTYIEQPDPGGLAQGYLLARDYLAGEASLMVLGDNVFFGEGLSGRLKSAADRTGGTVFGYRVADPERYGVVGFDAAGKVTSIVEKPDRPASDYAVTGIYFLDGSAPERAARLTPSPRGELEITDLLNAYRADGALQVERMGRGIAWLDTGTHASLLDAAEFIRTVETRQNLKIACPEEIAYLNGWIDAAQVRRQAEPYAKTQYGQYLLRMVQSV